MFHLPTGIIANINTEVPVSWCRNIETLQQRGEQFAKQSITALIGISSNLGH